MAGLGAKLKGLLGPHSMARQFFVWNVLAEVISAAATPFYQALRNSVNSAFPVAPLSPAELASLVSRRRLDIDPALNEARKSGVSEHDFHLMVANAANVPALGDMLRLFREGKETKDALVRVIQQTGFRDEWVSTLIKLGVQPPSPEMILEAYLQGQTDEQTAHRLYEKLGGDPEYFTLLYNTRGAAPTPMEAAQMAKRGIIPWEGTGPGSTSFEQAFLEGPWRNKWSRAFKDSSDYFPPPRSIVAMVRNNGLTREQATDLLRKQGVPPELIGAFLNEATHQKIEKIKELTESHISALYQDQAITDAEAMGMLQKLKYHEAEARFILLTWRLSRELKARNTAISTVHTQFLNHRIDNQSASVLLDRFRVPPNQRDALVSIWIEEQKAKVVTLTAAQVKTAAKKNIVSPDEAVARLTRLGYSEPDAVIFLQL